MTFGGQQEEVLEGGAGDRLSDKLLNQEGAGGFEGALGLLYTELGHLAGGRDRTLAQQAQILNSRLGRARGEAAVREILDGAAYDRALKELVMHLGGGAVAGYTRRFFTRVLAGLGVSELAHHITFGATPGPSSVIGSLLQSGGSEASEEDGAAIEEVDHAADQVIHEAEKYIEQGKNPNEAILLAIDLCGTANFFKGVRDLLPAKIGPVSIPGKPVGHINTTRYAVMLGLSALKYVASDETGRHHLKKETEASLKAFGIISGTIVAAEGLQLDLATAYEKIAKRQPDQKDKVAVMNLLGSLVSPAVTTVGSASLIRKMSNDLAKTGEKVENEKGEMVDEVDHSFAAIAVSHISNLSGYLFFGDPPFIAVCEKFGFKEGVAWQMKTMWPLAIASLVSSTIKLNLILAQREELTGKEAYQKATHDAFEGLKANFPVVIELVLKSLKNAAKYFSAGDLKWAQDPAGIQLQVGEVMMEKLEGLKHLFLIQRELPARKGGDESQFRNLRGRIFV